MEKFIIWGALVNALLVLLGGAVGGVFYFIINRTSNSKIKDKAEDISSIMIKALGLPVLLIGIQGAIKGEKILVIILSIALGALIGGIIDLDGLVNKLGAKIESKIKTKGSVASGFVNGTLIFCIGAMIINGALESGLGKGHSIFYAKGLIDGVTAVFLSLSYGPVGLFLTAGAVLLLQGSLVYLATYLSPLLTFSMINEMSAVGSLLIMGIGLNMLGATKLKIMNYTPAIFLPIIFCLFL